MKRAISMLIMVQLAILQYGQIVADHTVVDLYDDIPVEYMNVVKTMLVSMAGQSHSGAYRSGQELLEKLDDAYQVQTFDGLPVPARSDQYLRIGRHKDMGESSFFSRDMINLEKEQMSEQNATGNMYDVMGFGWCWDMTQDNPPGGSEDPVYHVRWAGASSGGPDGNMRWGLDDDDNVLTGNSVNMDTYLMGIEEYNEYCRDNGFSTKWIFTTGPVDLNSGTENGFQREIKHDYIRAFVNEDNTRILFDYADILCWSNNNEKNVVDWNDDGELRSHAQIHPDNMKDYDDSFNIIPGTDENQDHIGEVGALRLAKAMWWMLARIAGWDGGTGESGVSETVYPNEDYLSLATEAGRLAVITGEELLNGDLSLVDLNGRIVDRMKVTGERNYLNLNALPDGIYIVVVTKGNNKVARRFIWQDPY